MIVYIFLIFFYFICGLITTRINNDNFSTLFLKNLLISLPIAVLICFRASTVGSDTNMYETLFNSFATENLSSSFLLYKTEVGFIMFCKLLGVCRLGFHDFILISGLINVLAFSYFFSKYSNNYGAAWLLFITLLFMPRCMNIVREMLAVSLFLLSLTFLLKNKKAIFTLSIVLLFFIHKSAILILLVLLFMKIQSDNNRRRILFTLCMLTLFLFNPLMNLFVSYTGGKYDYLLESQYIDTEGGVAKFFNIILAFFVYWCFYKYIKIVKRNKTACIFENKVWEAIVSLNIVLSFAGLSFGLADRASLYFFTSSLIFIPNYIFIRKKELLPKYILINSFFIAYFIMVMVYRNNWHSIVPYNFYWD